MVYLVPTEGLLNILTNGKFSAIIYDSLGKIVIKIKKNQTKKIFGKYKNLFQ